MKQIVFCLLCLVYVGATARTPNIRVIEINDHILAFYTGRAENYDSTKEKNWAELGALDLGVATYAVYQGNEAVVYDTFTSFEEARWVRSYLEKKGIHKFTVVLSHWHLDHIGGTGVYADSNIVATEQTRAKLHKNVATIRAGTLWGAPAISSLRLPDVTFKHRLEISLGDLRLELHNVNIHSVDTNLMYMPAERILFAGDALEDTLTFMGEIENVLVHVKNLEKLKNWKIDRIYPNHGDPKIIARGGYPSTLIDATVDYITKMVEGVERHGYLGGAMEDYIEESISKGWISHYEPYRSVHRLNLQTIYNYHTGLSAPFP